MTTQAVDQLGKRVKFSRKDEQWHAMNHEVRDRLLANDSALLKYGRRKLMLKSIIIICWLTGSYALLMLQDVWWSYPLLLGSIALAAPALGMCVMHDANHQAFGSKYGNALGFAMDLLGGSMVAWKETHNRAHHDYPNLDRIDPDIGRLPFIRFHPEQFWRPYFRGQHVYAWFLYGFGILHHQLGFNVQLFRYGSVNGRRIGWPKGRDLVIWISGKVLFWSLAIAIPLAVKVDWGSVESSLKGIGLVIGSFVLVSWVVGLFLSVTFQLAHAIDGAEFSSDAAADWDQKGLMPWTHARWQILTTQNFCISNSVWHRMLSWYMGGLNYQIEHHLWPWVPHTLHHGLSPTVNRYCDEVGLVYRVQPTLLGALRSHYLHLKKMGQAPIEASAA